MPSSVACTQCGALYAKDCTCPKMVLPNPYKLEYANIPPEEQELSIQGIAIENHGDYVFVSVNIDGEWREILRHYGLGSALTEYVTEAWKDGRIIPDIS